MVYQLTLNLLVSTKCKYFLKKHKGIDLTKLCIHLAPNTHHPRIPTPKQFTIKSALNQKVYNTHR